jgi:hypothetical protein
MKCIVPIVLLSTFLVPTAQADDYTRITDAAYCVGVVARNVDLSKKEFGSALIGDEQLLARYLAVRDGAIRQNKIDMETANKLTLVGHQDAQICWDNTKQCMAEAAKRAAEPSADLDKNARIDTNCHRKTEAVCKRLEACY